MSVLKYIIILGAAMNLAAGAYAQPASGVNATVTDSKGNKTIVQGVRYQKKAWGQSYYINVESQHKFVWPYVPIDTGDFIVKLPLDAIRTFTVTRGTRSGPLGDQTYRITALTAGGQTSFSGEMTVITAGSRSDPNRLGGFEDDDVFLGTTDFGTFTISVANVRSIVFIPSPTPSAKTNKSRTPTTRIRGSLLLADGSRLQLSNIFPVTNTYNHNDVAQGEEPVAEFDLYRDGGSDTKIRPSSLKAIRFLSSCPGNTNLGNQRVIEVESVSGQKLCGNTTKAMTSAFGIDGIAQFADAEFEIIVPFSATAKELDILH